VMNSHPERVAVLRARRHAQDGLDGIHGCVD
jgi:hypothetical protein